MLMVSAWSYWVDPCSHFDLLMSGFSTGQNATSDAQAATLFDSLRYAAAAAVSLYVGPRLQARLLVV